MAPLCLGSPVHSQVLKKAGIKKAKSFLKNVIGEEEDSSDDTPDANDDDPSDEATKSKKSLNTELTPEDITNHMDEAAKAFAEKDYSETRFNLQQAMAGVELELGRKVLESMPEEVLGVPFNPDEDQVVSTGMGFIGLTINRDYQSDKGEISAAIANNSTLLMPYNMALSNPQMTTQEENMKIVKVNGHRGVLELDEDEYKLGIPFGQSSVFILTCDACADEGEVISAAEAFDIDGYLKILGESPIELDEN